jgi:hypothetical protein
VLRALKGYSDLPGPSFVESELARELATLATGDEMRSRLTSNELVQMANDLDSALIEIAKGLLNQATRKWWVKRKVLDTQRLVERTRGEETLAAYDIIDENLLEGRLGELKLKPKYAGGRQRPTVGTKFINAMAARRVGLSGERKIRELKPDRINIESIAPRTLKNPRK